MHLRQESQETKRDRKGHAQHHPPLPSFCCRCLWQWQLLLNCWLLLWPVRGKGAQNSGGQGEVVQVDTGRMCVALRISQGALPASKSQISPSHIYTSKSLHEGRGFLPSKPELQKLWLQLWEPARKEIKGSATSKQLQLQPLAANSHVSPPCVCGPKDVIHLQGIIAAELAAAVCSQQFPTVHPRCDSSAMSGLWCQMLPKVLLLGWFH